MKKKQKTNVQIVKEIMEFSDFGPLAQMFIIDAITKQAEAVSKTTAKDYPENMMIHPEAWINVAKEIKEKLEKAYKE